MSSRRQWSFLVSSILALAAALAACVPLPAGDAPMPPSPAGTVAPGERTGQLTARPAARAPELANARDPVWAAAQPVHVALNSNGRAGQPEAVELRALYTADSLYLWVRWPEDMPAARAADAHLTTENKLTVHWRIIPQTSTPPACEVACHTAHTDGAGRLAYIHAETIPPGSTPALHAAGGWQEGAWTLVWRRPLLSPNPYDLQFTDLSRAYPFFVKVFLDEAGRPDAVSALYELVFEP